MRTAHQRSAAAGGIESAPKTSGTGTRMRTVGHRKQRVVGAEPSGDALREGAQFNEEIHRLPTGQTTHIPKGIYRFKTHEEANRFDLECLARHMGRIARERDQVHGR